MRLITGEDQVARLVKELSRDVVTSWNPKLRGLLVPRGSEAALLVRVDPAASQIRTFVLGTRRPDEMFAALEETLRGVERRSSELAAADLERPPEPAY